MQENKINETYAKVNIRYMEMKSTHWMDYLDNNHVYKWGSYLTFDFLLKKRIDRIFLEEKRGQT